MPPESEKFFYVSAFGHFDDGYNFQKSGKVVSNASEFPSINFRSVRDGDFDFCLRAKVTSNSTLELIPTNCNLRSGIICKQKRYVPPLCINQAHITDPMQMLMDPALMAIKKTLVQGASDGFRKMFKRLNKRAAFESLFG